MIGVFENNFYFRHEWFTHYVVNHLLHIATLGLRAILQIEVLLLHLPT